ncbi:MAG TPA: DUF2059 domain-containing protein [Opitutaceae bacterium]|nr:DUF2059 domain-containing protein [Opitutaceae bacterium]
MKIKTCCLLCLALAFSSFARSAESAPAAAGDAPPQLRGLLAMGDERQFSLVTPGRMAPTWVKLGGKFDGWELAEFKAAEEALVLKKEGRTVTLKLAGSSIADVPASAVKATIADAEEVLRKMDFERMMTRMMEQQKVAMSGMAKQMAAGAGGKSADAEAIGAFQQKAMDVMVEAMNISGMKSDLAQIYSETFTRDELRGLSDFYGTPAGQAMVEKQPEVSQKLNAIIMPRMMAAMPKIQAMGKEFAAEQAAKRAAANPAPAAPPAEPAKE